MKTVPLKAFDMPQNTDFPLLWTEDFEMDSRRSRADVIERLLESSRIEGSPFSVRIGEDQATITVISSTPFLQGRLSAVIIDEGSSLRVQGRVGIDLMRLAMLMVAFIAIILLLSALEILAGLFVAGIFVFCVFQLGQGYARSVKQQLLAYMKLMCGG